jgi:hypothetical protein
MPDIQRKRRLLARIAGGIDNRLNPIMAKEMYQSVHSRAFLASVWLVLGLALLTCATVWVTQADNIGRAMFIGLFSLMAVMGLILLPATASQSVQKAIGTRTLELVQITGISAHQLARGPLLSVAARLVLLCSMLAPFAVLSYLFGGIDVLVIAAAIYLLVLGSLLLTAAGVLSAAVTMHAPGKKSSKSGFPILVIILVFHVSRVTPEISAELRSLLNGIGNWGEMLVTLGLVSILCILFTLLLLAAAANAFMFRQNRSSARPKLLLMLIMLVPALFLVIMGGVFGVDAPPNIIRVLCVPGFILLFFAALVWITDDPPQRRTQRAGNLLARQFCNGYGPTVRYLFMTMGGFFALCSLMFLTTDLLHSSDLITVLCLITVTMTYVLYPTAIARMITGWLPQKLRTVRTRRSVLVVFLFLNVMLMCILTLTEPDRMIGHIPGGLAAFVPILYFFRFKAALEPGRVMSHMALPALFGMGYYILAGLRSAQLRRKQEAGVNTKSVAREEHGPHQTVSSGTWKRDIPSVDF